MEFEATVKVKEKMENGICGCQQDKGVEGGESGFWDILADRGIKNPQEKAFYLPWDDDTEILRRRRKRLSEEELRQMWKAERARRRRRAEYLLMLEESAWKRKLQEQENTRAYVQGSIARTGGTAAYEAAMLMRPIRTNRLSKI